MIRRFDLSPAATIEQIVADCGVTRQAALKRISRLKAEGVLQSHNVVSEQHSTMPVRFVVFASVEAKDFQKKRHGIRDVADLACYIQHSALNSSEWSEISNNEPATDRDIRLEEVYPLSGGGEWDILIAVRGADADFLRNAFVSRYLPQLPGIVKTNTAMVILRRESEGVEHPNKPSYTVSRRKRPIRAKALR